MQPDCIPASLLDNGIESIFTSSHAQKSPELPWCIDHHIRSTSLHNDICFLPQLHCFAVGTSLLILERPYIQQASISSAGLLAQRQNSDRYGDGGSSTP